MTRRVEEAEKSDREPVADLEQAIAELEEVAVKKVESLITFETKALQERIRKLEDMFSRLQQAPPEPTGVTTGPGTAVTVSGRPQPSSRPNSSGTWARGRSAPTPASPPALPPLPARRTLATLAIYLEGLGFELKSYRQSGGGAWVFKTQEEFGHVAEHLKRNGVQVSRYPRGRKRYPGDHFEIDPYKVLPE